MGHLIRLVDVALARLECLDYGEPIIRDKLLIGPHLGDETSVASGDERRALHVIALVDQFGRVLHLECRHLTDEVFNYAGGTLLTSHMDAQLFLSVGHTQHLALRRRIEVLKEFSQVFQL